jgi:anaerobic magnesium-protoporphyrin IX monomethyl ester cyclase
MGKHKPDTMPGSDLARQEDMRIVYQPNTYSQQRQHEKKRWIWPVRLAMEATYMRAQGHEVIWDQVAEHGDKVVTEPEGIAFMDLPAADRTLTKAYDRKYQNNGNYKYHPGTYIQSAAGCWWGKCSFCVEHCNADPYQLRPVDYVINEIRICKSEGYKEIFDDAASFATGPWREEFCMKLMRQQIRFSCNMRFGVTEPKHYMLMRNSGFRMLLYGLESANQITLNTIHKGINIKAAISELMLASRYGLEPHVAVMFGYPWEDDHDAIRTLKLVHYLLRRGYAKTAQASVYDVPGKGYDLAARKYVQRIYDVAYYPDFWINRLKEIRNIDDIKYIWRGIKSCFGI